MDQLIRSNLAFELPPFESWQPGSWKDEQGMAWAMFPGTVA
jgi:hypothetical protein